MNHFLLIGHDCPFGAYPAPVVPVGKLDGKLVAVYAGAQNATVSEIAADSHFVVHSPRINEQLNEFSYERQRLFAYSADEVVSYATSEEREFLARVLDDSLLRIEDPFMRLALAKGTRDASVTLRELQACAKNLNLSASELIPDWYQRELESAANAGVDIKALPSDPATLLESAGVVSQKTREIIASLIRSVGGTNVVTRPDLPFDLYFEETDQYGKLWRTAVELELHMPVESAIQGLENIRQAYKKIVDRTWLVFNGKLSSRAAKMAAKHDIHLLKLDDLRQQAESMNSFHCLFIDAPQTTVRLRPWLQLNPRSRYDLIRVFPAVEHEPLAGVTLFAREYVGEILNAAENPTRRILTFDLLGAEADFPRWRENPLREVRLRANAAYAEAFGRKFPGELPGAIRVLIVNPGRITKEGASNLRSYLLHHLELGLGVGIMVGDVATRIADFARQYENICEHSHRLAYFEPYDFHDSPLVHHLWRNTALTAGTILLNQRVSFVLEKEHDIDRVFQKLQIPKSPRRKGR
jgi:hypothetical protein